MIEIIKHGTKQVTKCKKCGCEFSYDEDYNILKEILEKEEKE